MTAYCPACREYFSVPQNPPYGVIHAGSGENVRHLHAITREALSRDVQDAS